MFRLLGPRGFDFDGPRSFRTRSWLGYLPVAFLDDFLAGGFLAADFLPAAFLGDFLAADFFDAVFLAGVFLPAAFLGDFLAVAFLGADFLAGDEVLGFVAIVQTPSQVC